jgi:hypothetical protein
MIERLPEHYPDAPVLMTAMPSLQAIAAALGGRVVRGRIPHVAAPFPGKKKHDRSLHVFVNGDDIGVQVFRDGVDPIETKDYVRRVCGLPDWQPKRRKPKPKPAVPLSVRNHFFGETLAVCRLRRKIAPEHLALLINDLRLRGDIGDTVKYIREYGFGPADLERCMATTPRHYTADERAKILNLTYRERQQLGLRRTGSVDVDKAGRERARRDRYNAKRRATRARARCLGVNKRCPVEGRPSSQKEEDISTSIVERETDCEGKRPIFCGEKISPAFGPRRAPEAARAPYFARWSRSGPPVSAHVAPPCPPFSARRRLIRRRRLLSSGEAVSRCTAAAANGASIGDRSRVIPDAWCRRCCCKSGTATPSRRHDDEGEGGSKVQRFGVRLPHGVSVRTENDPAMGG